MLFYNSYKHNFLAGEMTNFIAGLKDLHQAPSKTSSLTNLVKVERFVELHTTGKNINSYGFGLAPYFISIAL